jgi:zinc transporter 9
MNLNKNKIAGFLPVLAALSGNFIITCLKFIGFFISGSGALFSEAIHSLADIANQALLMTGIARSGKKADSEFSYGYGHERFFWAIISACCIFFLGAGVTISHGVQALMKHQSINISPIIFIILFVSLIIDSFTFLLAAKELLKTNRGIKLREIFKNGDPATIAVLYEDGVAVVGVLVAFLSIALTVLTGRTYWDAIGSIIIGLLMAFMALGLIKKNRPYLIGRTMPQELKNKVIEMLEAEPTIEKVIDFKSFALDVNVYRIKCEVEFNSSVLLHDIYRNGFKEIYNDVKDDYDEFLKFCVEHTDRVPRIIGKIIDNIEKKIKNEIPSIRHIDIEIN